MNTEEPVVEQDNEEQNLKQDVNPKETSTTSSSSEETEVVGSIQELQQQVEKWKNDYLYLRAEFETYKRNAIKERAEITKYGSERLIADILTVADNFDRALATKLTPETIEVYSQGVKMTASELKSTLSRFGVNEIKCEGLPFDPSLHEALGTEESSTVAEGHILKVFRTAYKFHDRLIRPAQVIVARAPAQKS